MNTSELTAEALRRSLQAASMRQQVLANNIANATTPGFKRSRVDFETKLAEALRNGQPVDQVQPEVVQENYTIGKPDGNNVDIELEMSQLAENQIYYAALTRSLNDQFSRLKQVIDGR